MSSHTNYIRRAAEGNYKKRQLAQEYEQKVQKIKGAWCYKGFRKMLKKTYGNLYRAWKLALDTSGDGKISRNEFFASARNHGYCGNLTDLWNEAVSADGAFIRFSDFHPAAHKLMSAFN